MGVPAHWLTRPGPAPAAATRTAFDELLGIGADPDGFPWLADDGI